jgi:hypothetical protein
MLASSCLRSALRLVVRRLSFTRDHVTRKTRRRGLHPFTRMSRWSPVVSHFFDLARPVAQVGRRCSYRRRLPLSSAGTDWSVPSSCRAGRCSFTRYSSSTRARSSVRPLGARYSFQRPAVERHCLDLRRSLLGPVRCLRARRLASRAFSIRSPRGSPDLPLGLITRDHTDPLSRLRGAPSADHVPLPRKDQPLGRD